MRNIKKFVPLLFVLFFGIIVSCNKDGNSIYDPDYEVGADPVINTIVPEEGFLAGIDSVIIQGENFSDDPEDLVVDFGGSPGIVRSSSPTQIVVRTGLNIGNNIPVRVGVRGAINFSNTYTYKLDNAINPIPGYNQAQNTVGITRNAEGDIFYSLQNQAGVNQGISVWRTNDAVESYLPSQFSWLGLKFGPDGLIYGVNNNFGVYRERNGAIDTNPFAIGNSSEKFRNLDFGEGNYLWVVGDNTDIARVDISNGSITRFPFLANLRAVRYFEGQLYVAGSFSESEEALTTQEVWVFDATDSQLSNPREVFTIENETEVSMQVQEITFDASGRMYIGSNTGSGVYTWSEQEGFQELYSGLIKPTGISFTWVDTYLVASITNAGASTRHPIKIDLRREGAPYLGISE